MVYSLSIFLCMGDLLYIQEDKHIQIDNEEFDFNLI